MCCVKAREWEGERRTETETTVCGCEECWKFTTLHKNVQAKLLKLIAINISGPPRAGLNFFAQPVEFVRARQTGSGGKRERECAWGGRLVWGCRRLIEHVVGCCSLQLKLKLGEQQRPLGTLPPPPSTPPHTPCCFSDCVLYVGKWRSPRSAYAPHELWISALKEAWKLLCVCVRKRAWIGCGEAWHTRPPHACYLWLSRAHSKGNFW